MLSLEERLAEARAGGDGCPAWLYDGDFLAWPTLENLIRAPRSALDPSGAFLSGAAAELWTAGRGSPQSRRNDTIVGRNGGEDKQKMTPLCQ